jgi:hypothetical protein
MSRVFFFVLLFFPPFFFPPFFTQPHLCLISSLFLPQGVRNLWDPRLRLRGNLVPRGIREGCNGP